MSTFDFIKATENTITNSVKGLGNNSTGVLNGFLAKTKFSSISNFSKSYSSNQRGAAAKAAVLKKKHSRNLKSKIYANEVNSVIGDSKSAISAVNMLSIRTVTNLINGFTSKLTNGLTSNVNRLINSELSKLTNKIGLDVFNENIAMINGIVSNANNTLATIISTQKSIASFNLDTTIASLQAGLNRSLNSLESLNPLNSNISIASISPVQAFKKTNFDFFKRKEGESSTSKYIQANIPSIDGLPKPNLGILKETPDAKIITPKLKKDTNVTKPLISLSSAVVNKSASLTNSFIKNIKALGTNLTSIVSGVKPKTTSNVNAAKIGVSVPSLKTAIPNLDSQVTVTPIVPSVKIDNPTLPSTELLATSTKMQPPTLGKVISGITPTLATPGTVPPIIPAKQSSEVKEEKPSGDKAEYGKIQVKENKGGFVEISDETPGNVRKINLHPTGTYDAKLDNGDAHTKTTGKKVDIVDGNWEVTIFEDSIQIVNKNTKIEIREDKFENIHGSQNLNIDKEQLTKVLGNVSNDFGANVSTKINQDNDTSINGNNTETINGNSNETVKGNLKETVSGNLTINVSGNVNITGKAIDIKAASMVSISAPKVKIN